MSFPFVNLTLSAAEFTDYVNGYDFGPVPPDFLVYHHTANPAASWAPAVGATNWDANEGGLSDAQIKAKRLRQLANTKAYYERTLGWNAGPHLFIDDHYILLMSPMNAVGIHAMWGNSFTRNGHLHYSVGIEVIGCYTKVRWPDKVAANVRAATQALHNRLGIALDYMYADGVKPGSAKRADGSLYCPHPERLRYGGLSSHRDYNKPACPGDAITEAFYLDVVRATAVNGAATVAPSGLKTYRVRPNVKASIRTSPAVVGTPVNVVRKLSAGATVLVDVVVPGMLTNGSNQWAHMATVDGVQASEGFIHIGALEVQP